MPGSVWDGFSPLRRRPPEVNWLWSLLILVFFMLSGAAVGVLLGVFGLSQGSPDSSDRSILNVVIASALIGAVTAFLWVLLLWRKMKRSPREEKEDERVVWSIAHDWVPPTSPIPGEQSTGNTTGNAAPPRVNAEPIASETSLIRCLVEILSHVLLWPVDFALMVFWFLTGAYGLGSLSATQTATPRPRGETGLLGNALIVLFVTLCGSLLCGGGVFVLLVFSGMDITSTGALLLEPEVMITTTEIAVHHAIAGAVIGGGITFVLCLYAFQWMRRLNTMAEAPKKDNPWTRYFGT